MGRTDYHLFTDPEFCFKAMIDKPGRSLKLQDPEQENGEFTFLLMLFPLTMEYPILRRITSDFVSWAACERFTLLTQ